MADVSTATVQRVAAATGAYEGRRVDGVSVWLGMPYAKAPTGEHRWRAPRPVGPHAGVRDATRPGPVLPQVSRGHGGVGTARMDEDALVVNVWSPAAAQARRPVMVWIHGGAYTTGSGTNPDYDGARLAREGDVVVVSLNYRLGALGYLDLTTLGPGFESNLGLRDQVCALAWVRDNVEAFGGDPDRVTVFGESAGGNAVTTLLAVPAARGLFRAAIAQSPAPTAVYGPELNGFFARRFLDALGREDTGGLRGLPTRALTHAVEVLMARMPVEVPGSLCLAPSVDGDVLPAHPLDAIRDGTAHRVPLVIGTNRDEASLFIRARPSILPIEEHASERMFALVDPAARDRVVAAYAGWPRRSGRLALAGDWSFWAPSVWVAQAHSAYAPTRMYRFDHSTPVLRLARLGATHGIELLHVFGNFDRGNGRLITLAGGRATAERIGARMRRRWAEFAHDPVGYDPSDWPCYDDARRSTLLVAEPDSVVDDPGAHRRRAWEGVGIYR